SDPASAEKSSEKLKATLTRLQEKGKIPDASKIWNAITYVRDLDQLSGCQLVIEAIIEHLDVKKQVLPGWNKSLMRTVSWQAIPPVFLSLPLQRPVSMQIA